MKARSALLPMLFAPARAFGEQQPSDPEVIFPQRFTARDLLYACNSSALTDVGRERRRYCAGFISGVEEAVRLLQAGQAAGGGPRICLPVDVSSRRLADMYTRYAARNDAVLEQPAAPGNPGGARQRLSLSARPPAMSAPGRWRDRAPVRGAARRTGPSLQPVPSHHGSSHA